MTDNFTHQAESEIRDLLLREKPTLMTAYGLTGYELKADKSVVTSLDKELEEKLRELFIRLDPGIGVEGEEDGKAGNIDTYWLIDPIDGTEQFIRGIPNCRHQICLVDNGRVVFSLINMFVTDEWWVARAGGGTTCNGQAMRMVHRPIERSWISVSVKFQNAEAVQKVQALESEVARIVIATGNTTQVASGQIDGILAYKASGGPWDYAPRSLILTEAGARIENLGTPGAYDFRNNNFLVAHPDNFDELMNLVA